jgi:hypothetical protein
MSCLRQCTGPLFPCSDSNTGFFAIQRHGLVCHRRASESSGLTVPSMESTIVQPLLNDLPHAVDFDATTPTRRLRSKRKPKLANEGRAPNQDRKRTKKKHTTIPTPSTSKTACPYRLPRTKPNPMTAAFLHGPGLDRQKPCTSTIPAHPTQTAPADPSPKPAFTLPHLQLRTASKTTSQPSLHPARKSSYERRHGGPQFTICEDTTATRAQFLFGSDHPFFPWHLTPSATRQGSDNPGGDQENTYHGSQEIPALGLRDGADEITMNRLPMKAKFEVSKQALHALRMMR